ELTAGPAALEAPRPADHLPEARVQDPRVRRIHRQLRGAGLVVDVRDLLPALAAVLGAEHAALRVGSEGVALHRDVDQVRVLGADAGAGDLRAFLETAVLPGLPRVGGLVHAVAVGDVAADRRFAHADVQHVGIGLSDRDGAHRAGADGAVADRQPAVAAVRG